MVPSLFLLLLAVLPLAILPVAFVWRFYPWNTRIVPADAVKIGVTTAFVTALVPAWGPLALMSALWWWIKGWPQKSGATLWPFAAMAVYLGLQAPAWAVSTALAVALGAGVLQVLLAVSQYCAIPIFLVPDARGGFQIIGTLGHRTGLSIYLAILIPLSFGTPLGWELTAIYCVGLFLARSAVGTGAAVVGFLWVQPTFWPLGLLGVIGGVLHRFLKWQYHVRWDSIKPRMLDDTVKARLTVWTITLKKTLPWPYWLIGHGADSFHIESLKWLGRYHLGEAYREAHNDYLEFFYEYGMVGLLAMGAFLGTLWPAVHRGDPITGGLLAFGTASLGNFPVRVAPMLGLGLLILIVLMRRSLGP